LLATLGCPVTSVQPLAQRREGVPKAKTLRASVRSPSARKSVCGGQRPPRPLTFTCCCWATLTCRALRTSTRGPLRCAYSAFGVRRYSPCNRSTIARAFSSVSASVVTGGSNGRRRAQTLVAHAGKDEQLRQHLGQMKERAEVEVSEAVIHPARQKVWESLQAHWDGLTVFVEHPSVPLDNNQAERVLRGPVVGRKNYRGSGAVWSGELAAMQFSVFQTLCLWDMNPRVWLGAYLAGCARAGGEAPADLGEYLPWQMTEEKRREWSLEREAQLEDSS